jgi:hypothetical protein
MYSHEDRMTGPEKSVYWQESQIILIHAWIADSSETVEFCRIAENECISPETPPRLLFASLLRQASVRSVSIANAVWMEHESF